MELQHLADPARPRGSYRRGRSSVSDVSSDFTSESSGSKATREAETVARMASYSSIDSYSPKSEGASVYSAASAYSAASSQPGDRRRPWSGRHQPPVGRSGSFGGHSVGSNGSSVGGGSWREGSEQGEVDRRRSRMHDSQVSSESYVDSDGQ